MRALPLLLHFELKLQLLLLMVLFFLLQLHLMLRTLQRIPKLRDLVRLHLQLLLCCLRCCFRLLVHLPSLLCRSKRGSQLCLERRLGQLGHFERLLSSLVIRNELRVLHSCFFQLILPSFEPVMKQLKLALENASLSMRLLGSLLSRAKALELGVPLLKEDLPLGICTLEPHHICLSGCQTVSDLLKLLVLLANSSSYGTRLFCTACLLLPQAPLLA
mmetsp:Transcript_6970/g.11712  ORF Transcript_6970/g.11712 Transcript_6970/m.11712 type:complete len:217 (+) Transcript_6970:1364-2014(+)